MSDYAHRYKHCGASAQRRNNHKRAFADSPGRVFFCGCFIEEGQNYGCQIDNKHIYNKKIIPIYINHLERKIRMKFLNVLPIIMSAVLLCAAIAVNRSAVTNAQTAVEGAKTVESYQKQSEFSFTALKQEDEEMRGIWVSYMTLDMQGTAKTRSEFEEKFDAVVSHAVSGGFNTLVVQVRPFCDALYYSEIFPMSHILSGEQGRDCGYDPLAVMCEKAHSNGLKIHAWINPYRVKNAESAYALAESSPAVKNSSLIVEVEGGVYFNPALEEVTELIAEGVAEIVKNYDVDGIQFDDYFYPTTDKSFDSEQYAAYISAFSGGGAPLSLEEWRMDNVNRMLSTVYKTVHESGEGVVFGVSPQGNLSNNSALCADVVRWCTESGYADYICPQIYFSLDNPTLTFEAALADWTGLELAENIKMYIGIAGYKAGSDSDCGTWEDNSDILSREIEIIRDKELDGFMLYSYDSLVTEEAAEEIRNVIALLT